MKESELIKKILKFALGGIFLFCAGGFYEYFTSREEIHDQNNYSAFQTKKDSLENVYQFKLDSLKKNYESKLNKLEGELE